MRTGQTNQVLVSHWQNDIDFGAALVRNPRILPSSVFSPGGDHQVGTVNWSEFVDFSPVQLPNRCYVASSTPKHDFSNQFSFRTLTFFIFYLTIFPNRQSDIFLTFI